MAYTLDPAIDELTTEDFESLKAAVETERSLRVRDGDRVTVQAYLDANPATVGANGLAVSVAVDVPEWEGWVVLDFIAALSSGDLYKTSLALGAVNSITRDLGGHWVVQYQSVRQRAVTAISHLAELHAVIAGADQIINPPPE